jgi:FdhD protein
LKELTVGHLLSEGVLKSIEEINQISLEKRGKCQVELKSEVDLQKRTKSSQPFARLVSTTCGSQDHWPLAKLIDRLGLPKLQLGFRVRAEVISESTKRLNTVAEIFRRTGGVHVAALYAADGSLITYAEDVGRHNAVDKVIGLHALRKGDFSQHFLASSGRLSGDVVLKAVRMRVPVVSSLAAAINSGIEVARQAGVTLIGFVRGQRMNIYTFPERIILE